MTGFFSLVFVSFFFGGIYCAFTDRITLYCGRYDWWSLFFGVVFSFSVHIMNTWLQVPEDSIYFGIPFAIALISLLYNMYITFKVNMLHGRGVWMSIFAVMFKSFILTIIIIFILGCLTKGSKQKKRSR